MVHSEVILYIIYIYNAYITAHPKSISTKLTQFNAGIYFYLLQYDKICTE